MDDTTTELGAETLDPVLHEDLPCRGCQYNLRGLPHSGNCPECGKPIRNSLPRGKELSGRLAGLSLPRQIMVLAVWPLFEQVLNFLVGFVDTMLAGHLNVEATNAVAVSAYVGWLMSMTEMAIGIGATAVISRAIGGKHKRVANAALGQAIMLSMVLGLFVGLLVYAAAPSLAKFLNVEDKSLVYALQYMRITAAATCFNSVLLVGCACLRATGDTRTPFQVLAAVNVVNAVVSYTLVKLGWEVVGIAVGTAAAWAVGSMLILNALFRGWGLIRLRLFRMRPHWHTTKRIGRIALASFAESIGMWCGNFLVLKIVGEIGQHMKAALGAHIVTIRIESFSFLPCFALGMAASTLTGQYLGLGDVNRAKRAGRLCWAYGAAVMSVIGITFIAFPEAWIRLVTNKPELLAVSPHLLRICGFVQAFFATAIVLSSAMRGAGDTRITMSLSYFSIFVVRLPLAYLFGIHFNWGLEGVWYALCAELVFRGVIFGARYLHGGWVRATV